MSDLFRIAAEEESELPLLVSDLFQNEEDERRAWRAYRRQFRLLTDQLSTVAGSPAHRSGDHARWYASGREIELRLEQEDRLLPLSIILSSKPRAADRVSRDRLTDLSDAASLPTLVSRTPYSIEELVALMRRGRWSKNFSTNIAVSAAAPSPATYATYREYFDEIAKRFGDQLGAVGVHELGETADEIERFVWSIETGGLCLTLGHALGRRELPIWISVRGISDV